MSRRLWKDVKESCNLDNNEVRKARALGLSPKRLLEYEKKWHEPVKTLIAKLYEERYYEGTSELFGKKVNTIFKINKFIIYLVLGIIILVLRDDTYNYLYLLIAIPSLVLNIEQLSYEIYERAYYKKANLIGACLLKIALALIILIMNADMLVVCVLWGISIIISSTITLDESTYLVTNRKIFAFLIEVAESIVQIVFAVLLIIDPVEHISFHIILLGVEMLLIAARVAIEFIYKSITYYKNQKKLTSANSN